MSSKTEKEGDYGIAFYHKGESSEILYTDATRWAQLLFEFMQTSNQPLLTSVAGNQNIPEKNSAAKISSDKAIKKFADKLEVTENRIIEHFSPRKTAPYITFNREMWSRFDANTPKRGVSAIARIVTIATISCLWLDSTGTASGIKQKDCLVIAKKLGLKKNNWKRAFERARWLILEDGEIRVDRRSYEIAIGHAKTYIEKAELDKAA